MAVINTHIRRQPKVESPQEALGRDDEEWQGWQLHRLPTSLKYTRSAFGLKTSVTDYGQFLYWTVLGKLDDIEAIFHGRVMRDPDTDKHDALLLALETARAAAGRLRLAQVVPLSA